MSLKNDILSKIDSNSVKIGILGLGYVGLPLAVTFAKKGISVLGFEKAELKCAKVNNSENYIGDVNDDDLSSVVKNNILQATTDFTRIKECDAMIICVPTPLDKFKKPDMSYIESACVEIGSQMKRGTLISLESTTYPTTTENFMKPIIEETSKMTAGKDFWLCFSPERVDPGNKDYKTENTPKILGGLDENAAEIGVALYAKAIDHIHKVSSPRVAEMVKILENTYRLVNISLMNEIALLCGKMDIDIWEVIEAAKTKPYGFHAFYPGPGIGGHCIPLDPFYLEYIAKKYNFDLTMINVAGNIDNAMPHRMTVKIQSALNRQEKPIRGSKILFIGVAYKNDIDDSRESPALKIMDEVKQKGGKVFYFDPYIDEVKTDEGDVYKRVPMDTGTIGDYDCVVITTKHSVIDFEMVSQKAKLVVDLRNAISEKSDKIVKL